MSLLLILLILVLLFGGVGFAAHALWVLAVVFLAVLCVAALGGSRF